MILMMCDAAGAQGDHERCADHNRKAMNGEHDIEERIIADPLDHKENPANKARWSPVAMQGGSIAVGVPWQLTTDLGFHLWAEYPQRSPAKGARGCSHDPDLRIEKNQSSVMMMRCVNAPCLGFK